MKFLRLTLVEMRRAIHRRLVRWMILIALAFSALAGLIVFLTSGDTLKFAQDPGHPARMANWWTAGSGDDFLLVAAFFIFIGAAICGASVAGAEWRAGTVTTVLTWVPSRVRLHLARTSSAVLLAFVISFLLQTAYLLSAMPAVVVNGNTNGTDSAWWSALILAMLRVSLVASLVAVLALSIATIGRNTSAALIVLATWALVIERTVVGLRPKLARYMISENIGTLIEWSQLDGVDFERRPIVSLFALASYLAVVIAIATVLFARRDIATS